MWELPRFIKRFKVDLRKYRSFTDCFYFEIVGLFKILIFGISFS
ncbi:hypothetical protein LEP1GSC074_0062 [Leptospira noguchii str. Hook]|nr:hypothetical protein LEP1GSC074_0062 [Leptospira noguchii str. Hook]